MAEPISKVDAVRDALKRGFDRPQQAVEWIKENHGVEMSTAMFSSYKSNEMKKGGGGEAKEPEKKAAPATHVVAKRTQTETPTPSPAKPAAPVAQKPTVVESNGNGSSFDLELAKQVKGLVAVHGIEKVRELVNLFE